MPSIKPGTAAWQASVLLLNYGPIGAKVMGNKRGGGQQSRCIRTSFLSAIPADPSAQLGLQRRLERVRRDEASWSQGNVQFPLNRKGASQQSSKRMFRVAFEEYRLGNDRPGLI